MLAPLCCQVAWDASPPLAAQQSNLPARGISLAKAQRGAAGIFLLLERCHFQRGAGGISLGLERLERRHFQWVWASDAWMVMMIEESARLLLPS